MNGLSVRWSLTHAAPEVAERLTAYVRDTSHDRFSGMPGLRFKTWRLRPGEWFEGTYVFVDDAARRAFQEEFERTAAQSPGSQIVGAAPVLIEPWDVTAVAEGGSGFVALRPEA